MTGKIEYHKNEAREAIKKGIDRVANTVKVTLGPRGRNVILDRPSYPNVTKDGVTVAKEFAFKDKLQNLGASFVKHAADKTVSMVGDGTTSAVILLQAIITEGINLLSAGANPQALKRGIEKTLEKAVDLLDKKSKKIEEQSELEEVATISANNDRELGVMIAEIFEKIGKDGVVTVEEVQKFGLTKEFVDGIKLERGYINPHFINNPERNEVVLENPFILLADMEITANHQIVPILEKIAQSGNRSMLVLAEDVSSAALATLIVNKMNGTFQVVAVKSPGFGDIRFEILEDIALLTGGKVVSERAGIKPEDIAVEDLGRARKVVVSRDSTTVIEGKGNKEKVSERIEQIRNQIENKREDWATENLKERLAKLSQGVAVLKVGGASDIEVKERKYRIDDTVHATRAALQEGIVAGGGVPLYEVSKEIDISELVGDEKRGGELFIRALEYPLRTLVENSGKSPEDVFAAITKKNKPNWGWDALTGKYGDLLKMGIIDPLKVVRTALSNAASVASMVLTSESAVVDEPEEQKSEK